MNAPTRDELDALAEACEIASQTLGRSATSIIQDGSEDAARGLREGKAAEKLLSRAANRLRHFPLPEGDAPTADGFREWRHPCHAVQGEPVLWVERCPHCGMPRPEPSAATLPADEGRQPEEPCTEISAVWCPNHGDCTCKREAAETDGEYEDPECPLHARSSSHAEKELAKEDRSAALPAGEGGRLTLAVRSLAPDGRPRIAVDQGETWRELTREEADWIVAAHNARSVISAREGERERIAATLEESARRLVSLDGAPWYPLSPEVYDRAAALLREPGEGVGREAVLRLVAGARHTTCLPGITAHQVDAAFADLLAAIRAVPEAQSSSAEFAWRYLPELPERERECLVAYLVVGEILPSVGMDIWTGDQWVTEAGPLIYSWQYAPEAPEPDKEALRRLYAKCHSAAGKPAP